MDNHFHLLVQTMKANLAEFMRRFNICYTGWFNYRHRYCGHLYQGRYKAFLIEADSYLLEVSRYLHLNCVRVAKVRDRAVKNRFAVAHAYPWSSLSGYLDQRKAEGYITYETTLSLIGGRPHYGKFIREGLAGSIPDPFKEVKFGLILGDDDFVDQVRMQYVREGSDEQPSYREMVIAAIAPEEVISVVSRVLNIARSAVTKSYGSGFARGLVSELLYRYSGLRQREIGNLLGGIDYSAVSRLRTRLHQKIEQDSKAGDIFQAAEAAVKELSIVKI
jgi:hypothetical protein